MAKESKSASEEAFNPPLANNKSFDYTTVEVSAVRILQDPPVENCELRPFVLLKDECGNQSADLAEDLLQYQWLRGQKRICSVQRCTGSAEIQCTLCLRLKHPPHLTFFCSAAHFAQAWSSHSKLHRQSGKEFGDDWENDDCSLVDASFSSLKSSDDPKLLNRRFPPPLSNLWAKVSNQKLYIPRAEDVGRMLRLEVAPFVNGKLGAVGFTETSSVLSEPEAPPPRNMVYSEHRTGSSVFKVLSYNILADMYATRRRYPYCPLWALLWTYRRNNILRELLISDADVVSLQEVQLDHFDDFLYPKMKEAGYEGIFKRKTRAVLGDNPKQMDGCAIFYKETKFALMEQYSIEYNEAARQHVDTQLARHQRSGRLVGAALGSYRTNALKRLMKGNVALVVVLEDISAESRRHKTRRKRRLCVANTHVFWDPDFSDVKLWQSLVLCQELDKLVLSRNLPLIICGDFNSTLESAVYDFLRHGQILSDNDVFELDEHNILPPPSSITHRLPLASAYDELIGEPKYTNYTGDFVGVLDYIWYMTTNIRAVGVLAVDEEYHLQEYTALPSPRYPSDHIRLLTEFEWVS